MSERNQVEAADQSSRGARPGQMTAVMRAMQAPSGPMVLNVAMTRGNRTLDERIFKQRASVTVGTSEQNTFLLPNSPLPAGFKLIELIGSDYVLNFVDGMAGRVALPSGVTDLEALKNQAKLVNGAYQVRLPEDVRGKVNIGEHGFLFRFVPAPAQQPKPQLPLAVMAGLTGSIDWTLTVLAAFSFLVHFGMVGFLFSEWMDPHVKTDDELLQAAIDTMKAIPAPPPPEEKKEEVVDKKVETKTPEKAAAAAGPSKDPGKKAPVSDAAAARLAGQAAAIQMELLGAFGGNSAVAGALNRGDTPGTDLSKLAASSAGASGATGALSMGGGGGPIAGGVGGKGGLGGIGGGTGASGTGAGAGGETKVAGPKGDISTGVTSMSVPVNNAERVIAGLRGRFKSCYQRGLSEDPNQSGKATFSVKVAPNGEVALVTVASNAGLSATVTGCIQRALQGANFDAPGGSGSALSVPVNFVQQGK